MSPNVRWLALILCVLGAACAKSDARWLSDLHSPDPFVRGLAAIGLSLQAPRSAAPAVPVLLEMIDRGDVGLERKAAHALSLVGPFFIEELLAQLVGDELMSADRRGAIQNALVSASEPAASSIVRCLAGPGRERAGDLGDVLLQIGEPAVPAIVRLLENDDDFALQDFAAFLLGKLGPRARMAEPALQRALDSPNAGVRQSARNALQRIAGYAPSANSSNGPR